jgi:hypothetical protein
MNFHLLQTLTAVCALGLWIWASVRDVPDSLRVSVASGIACVSGLLVLLAVGYLWTRYAESDLVAYLALSKADTMVLVLYYVGIPALIYSMRLLVAARSRNGPKGIDSRSIRQADS